MRQVLLSIVVSTAVSRCGTQRYKAALPTPDTFVATYRPERDAVIDMIEV